MLKTKFGVNIFFPEIYTKVVKMQYTSRGEVYDDKTQGSRSAITYLKC